MGSEMCIRDRKDIQWWLGMSSVTWCMFVVVTLIVWAITASSFVAGMVVMGIAWALLFGIGWKAFKFFSKQS